MAPAPSRSPPPLFGSPIPFIMGCPPPFPYQDGFADPGHGLAGCGRREVDGKVGKAQDGDERPQPPLGHELLAVIVCGVVAQDGLHEFHLGNRERGKEELWGSGSPKHPREPLKGGGPAVSSPH